MRVFVLMLCGVLMFVVACQPAPVLNENGQLVAADSTQAAEDALPTLFLPGTNTPVIVPTAIPTLASTEPLPTEANNVPIATVGSTATVVNTPTQLPSKTPTVTPTLTPIASVTLTPTITVTATATPTSDQFSFEGRSGGSSSPAEATAYAINLRAAQVRAQQESGISGQNAFPPPNGGGGFGGGTGPSVNCNDGPQWGFPITSATSCPTAGVASSNAAFQRFQYGYMVWLQDLDRIFVLYVTTGNNGWEAYQDEWVDGMEECSQSQATNFASQQGWTPVQGFCLIWRKDGVGSRIGLSEDRYEYSYVARYQVGEDDTMAIEDNLGNTFYLGANNQWQLFVR